MIWYSLRVELGFRIPIVSGIVNSLNWIFGVQSPGFQIPQAKNFPDSGHWITFHGVKNGFSNCKQQYFFGRRGIGVLRSLWELLILIQVH